MLCLDVNVLIYAHRTAVHGHDDVRDRLERRLNSTEPVGVPDVVLSGFVRIVTNSKMAGVTSSATEAWSFVDTLLSSRAGTLLTAGPSHFSAFQRLSHQINATGNDIPDAFIAAYAVEQNATLVSSDRGFRRFDGLNVLLPSEL